jgi:hypothetical protein
MDLSSDLAVVIVIFLMNIVPLETLHSYLPTIYRYNMVDKQFHVMVNKSGSGWTPAISYGDFSCKVCYFYCSKGRHFWACHEGILCRGVYPLILNLITRWWRMVSMTPWPLCPQGKNPQNWLSRRLYGPQNQSGHSGGDRTLLPLPGIWICFLSHQALTILTVQLY